MVNEDTEIQLIKELEGEFISTATLGDNFIACLESKLKVNGIGNGNVYWVDNNLKAHKLIAEHEIKAIVGQVDRIYGLTKDGKYLYEWFPITNHDKDDRLLASKFKSTRNIYELPDDLGKYTMFCDLGWGKYFGMYLSETEPSEESVIEKGYPKSAIFDKIRDQLKDTPEEKRYRLMRKVMDPREENARRVYEEVYEKGKRDNILKGCENDVKEGFKVGVGAFKHYIKAKRGIREEIKYPSCGPIQRKPTNPTVNSDVNIVPVKHLEKTPESPHEDTKEANVQKEVINDILEKIKNIRIQKKASKISVKEEVQEEVKEESKQEIKEEPKEEPKTIREEVKEEIREEENEVKPTAVKHEMNKGVSKKQNNIFISPLLRRTLLAERIYDILATVIKRNKATGYKQIIRCAEKEELCSLIKKEMNESRRERALTRFLAICKRQMVLKTLEDLFGDEATREIRKKEYAFKKAIVKINCLLTRPYLEKWRKNVKKYNRYQAGAKRITEVSKKKVNDWVQRLLYGAAAIKAKKEMEQLQNELKEQTKAQQERASKTSTTLEELQADLNALEYYKTAAKNVSLKHFIGTLAPALKRKLKDHFKFFHESVPKDVPHHEVLEEDKTALTHPIKDEPKEISEKEDLRLDEDLVGKKGDSREVQYRRVPDVINEAREKSIKRDTDKLEGDRKYESEYKRTLAFRVKDEEEDKDEETHEKQLEQNVVDVSDKSSAQISDITKDTKAAKEQHIPSHTLTRKHKEQSHEDITKLRLVQDTKLPINKDEGPLVESKEMSRISLGGVMKSKDNKSRRMSLSKEIHNKEEKVFKPKQTTLLSGVKERKVSNEFPEHISEELMKPIIRNPLGTKEGQVQPSIYLQTEEAAGRKIKLSGENETTGSDILREQIENPTSTVGKILEGKRNIESKELMNGTNKLTKVLKGIIGRLFKELEREIINNDIIAQTKKTANVLPGNESSTEVEKKEIKLKQSNFGLKIIARIAKKRLSGYVETITQYASLCEVRLMWDKLEPEEHDLRGARIIKKVIADKIRIFVDALNSLTFLKVLQEEVKQMLPNQPSSEAIKKESIESSDVQYQHKETIPKVQPTNPTEQSQLKTEKKDHTDMGSFNEFDNLRKEALRSKDKLMHPNKQRSISELQISILPAINTFTPNQEERIIPYEVHVERSFSSHRNSETQRLKRSAFASSPRKLNNISLNYYSVDPISIVRKDAALRKSKRTKPHTRITSKDSVLERFLANPRDSIQSDTSIKEELKEDDYPENVKNMNEISPIKPSSNKKEKKTPKGAGELKEAYISALNTPTNVLIGKGKVPDNEDNSDIGMADPIELEAFLLPLKERRAIDRPLVGRFDHKQFIESFTKCFVKYHTLMVEEEKSVKAQKRHYKSPNESLWNIKGIEGNYPGQGRSRVSFASTSKEYIIPHVKDYDISQEFRMRLKKQPISSKFAKKNVEVKNKSKMSNVSLKPTTAHNPRKRSSDSTSINPLERSLGGFSRNAVEGRIPANYIRMNKKFIKELSNLNSEINSKYNCMEQIPRLKVKNPELVLQVVRYKAQLQDINRVNLSHTQSPPSKRNDDGTSSRKLQETTRRYN